MAKPFSQADWRKILNRAEQSAHEFGLPEARSKSLVIGTFNIRKLGKKANRPAQAWDFLAMIAERFDLLAVQEVQDDLEGLRELRRKLPKTYGLVVSDVTGVFPGAQGNAERLAFLFNWTRVERTELASDITYDRSKVVETLYENRTAFQEAWELHEKNMKDWRKRAKAAKAAGKKRPDKPPLALPRFLTFIRQPHCASFQVPGRNSAAPLSFLAVNAHLLYGTSEEERKWEFDALIEWLTIRAKKRKRLYAENIIMLGDCNLEFEKASAKRKEIDAFLKKLNETKLKSKRAAKVNFPLLSKRPGSGPGSGFLTTNARETETYDQIAIFAHDKRLPSYRENTEAGRTGPDGYDYGVFRFTDLFARALYGKKDFSTLNPKRKALILERCVDDVSDHMPAWFRLPIPGA